MIRRLLSLLILIWLLGFVWFSMSLPAAAGASKTDAIVVLTGGKGRIQRGLDHLASGDAKRLLVSGVDPSVRIDELAKLQNAPGHLYRCCVDLGKEAVDTRSNAAETAAWLEKKNFRSVRLVTSDWHMPRARFELERALGGDIEIISDAVPGSPPLGGLFSEYNKYLLRRMAALAGW